MRPRRDQRVEIGAGGQIVRQGVCRERHSAENHRCIGTARPDLKIEADAAPGLAGGEPGSIDPASLVAAGAAFEPGRNHRKNGPWCRGPGRFGELAVKGRDRPRPPREPRHPSHTGDIARAHGEPVGIVGREPGDRPRRLGTERLVHEALECLII